MPLKSVVERELPTTQEAQLKLDALRAQARDFAIASALALAGTFVAIVAQPRLVLVLVALTLTILLLTGRALWRRQELLTILLPARDAYSIDAVRRQAARFATDARRQRLANWVRKVVAVADGDEHPPSANVRVIDTRVTPRRERLLRLADAFGDDAREIHPASVALLHQLLTRPGVSPLYNPGIEEDLLELALHRVEAGIEPA